MADTGAPHFIPFADPTDLVRDWPALSEDVADAVAAGLTAAGNAGIGSNVVQTVKTDTFSTTSTTYVTVTGLTATITPSTATSKVLVIASVGFGPTTANSHGLTLTDSTGAQLVSPTSAGSRTTAWQFQATNFNRNIHQVVMAYLDSPGSATAKTYEVRALAKGGITRINRADSDDDDPSRARSISTLTLIEVAA